MMSSNRLTSLLLLLWGITVSMMMVTFTNAFIPSSNPTIALISSRSSRILYSASDASTSTAADTSSSMTNVLPLTLEKPLGLILEEVEEGAAKGVFILDLAEEGSVTELSNKDQLIGCKVASVMGEDVTSRTFDEVMDRIINAPSDGVEMELLLKVQEEAEQQEQEQEQEQFFPVGTSVSITVRQNGKADTVLEAKVGDNLRQVLLQNGVELYQGLKKKLGNCGGGGQCTFCAVDFIPEDSEGWEPRSEYEDTKLGKLSTNARLACLNNIQGPSTIRLL